jgi:tetratricopeptide (TPR) repeat protein
LRQAQLSRAERRWSEAVKLLRRARQVFGCDQLSACLVELEEAELAQEDGELLASSTKAGHVFEAFSEIEYAKGMADALRALGVSEQMRGRLDQALQWYVAALCVFPSTNHPSHGELWVDMVALRDQLATEQGSQGFRRLTGRIRQMIEGRQGEFSCLTHVAADRSADIARVLRILEPGLTEPHPIQP